MKPLRLVFAGTPEFGVPCLAALHQSPHQVIAVYTQPDRPSGRGRQMHPSAAKSWAESHQIPVYQPLNFKTDESVAELAALAPDVLVVIAYGLILPQRVLDLPKLGCINVHASLLPRWRGAAPIQQAILQGDAESGITLMHMDAGLDTGDMLARVACPLAADETGGSLHDKLAALAPGALLSTLENLTNGTSIRTPQDNQHATYAPKIKKEDAAINWAQSASVIARQIRAYTPWPIAFTHTQESVVRIHEAQVSTKPRTAAPGTIQALDRSGMLVATQDFALCVTRVQFPGGKVIALADYLNAPRNELAVGLVLQ